MRRGARAPGSRCLVVTKSEIINSHQAIAALGTVPTAERLDDVKLAQYSSSVPDNTARRVLVVDDEPEVGKALARLLRRAGFEVLVASSGEEALKHLDPFQPDVVLADYRMTGMSGSECLRAVAERRPSAARLLISGYTGSDVSGAARWAHEFLAKPWDSGELLAAVRRHPRAR
jgi:CheY-like chemotaxis protein